MAPSNVEIVQEGYRRLAAGDVDGVIDVVHPDFELRPVIAGTSDDAVYRGADGFRRYVADIAETWERFEQVPERIIPHGDDVVVVIFDLKARGKGSGLELSQNVAVVWTFKDGKPWRGIGYTDPDEALEAVGLRE